MQQDYDNGKYTVIFDRETGELRALRNGEAWQDLSGNKLVYWMLVEHHRALDRIAELEKDAARLDFVQSGVTVEIIIKGMGNAFDFMVGGKSSAISSILRDAIDAAMQKD